MKMRKQLFGALLALLLCVTMAVPAFASSNMLRLVDNAGLLTDSEQSELLDSWTRSASGSRWIAQW